ncbi:MAG: ABC transporter permease [Desulfobulbaceae bacterium]
MLLSRTLNFLADIYVKRLVIYELAKRDFQKQYMGSYLGFVWVFLEPLLFILILYFVFAVGLRRGGGSEMPFITYLVTGMIAWMFFARMLSVSTNVIKSHSFLVNRTDFRLSILPIVKLLSGTVPHLFFVFLALIICWVKGFAPSLYSLQVVYYFFAMAILLLGLAWITSSTSIFVADVGKFVSVVIRFGFWLTPIFWNINMIPAKYQWVIMLNPVYYIVNGYRDSYIREVPFWDHPVNTLYFWGVTLMIFYLGITVFGRLRPHFAEVI